MKPGRWEQINQVYYAALEVTGDERASFLAEACAGDAELRSEVESLLAAHAQADGFLDRPAMEEVARELNLEPPSLVGSRDQMGCGFVSAHSQEPLKKLPSRTWRAATTSSSAGPLMERESTSCWRPFQSIRFTMRAWTAARRNCGSVVRVRDGANLITLFFLRTAGI